MLKFYILRILIGSFLGVNSCCIGSDIRIILRIIKETIKFTNWYRYHIYELKALKNDNLISYHAKRKFKVGLKLGGWRWREVALD